MNPKTKNILQWALTALAALAFTFSAVGKIYGSDEMIKIALGFGFSAGQYAIIGVLELMAVALYLNPRTGVAGTLLLVGVTGGAIATHLQHQQSIIAPLIIGIITVAAAILRFPELSRRLLGSSSSV